ncbi:MAG TPA: hypothetical protein DCP90_04680 [Clostridiales bacterium]|nr:MAG: hypothetical protein A2Y22_06585 [Clostridiales bacterium GWD2_32_59]HAN09892.1 hypothetical protein [Clostridiales bacterium]
MDTYKINLLNKIFAISTFIMFYMLIGSIIIQAEGITGTCTGYDVNYRTGPDTVYGKVGQLQKSEKISIIGIKNNWYKFKTQNGYMYILKDFISTTNNAYVTGNNINVRAEANMNCEVIGELNSGRELKVLSQNQDWYKINFEGQAAWVFGEYIEVINKDFNSEVQNSNNKQTVAESNGTINADNVNLRKESNTTSSVITKLAKNTNISTISKSDGWYHIKANNNTGWVLSTYVTISPTTTSSTNNVIATTAKLDYVYVISQQGVNLREYPTIVSNKKLSLAFGAKLKVVKEVNSGWIQVQTNDGEEGYVSQEFVDEKLLDTSVPKENNIVNAESTKSTSSEATSIIEYSKKFLGTKYVWGGNSLTGGIDCSGFTKNIMSKFNINIPRTAKEQANSGSFVKRDELKSGDLVFFDTLKKGYITHVGIYIGNNKFIHASSSNNHSGVVITALSDYGNVYRTARRVLN